MKFIIKKEVKINKIPTSMTLKQETMTKLEKINKVTGVSNSSIIDQVIEQGEFEGVDDDS